MKYFLGKKLIIALLMLMLKLTISVVFYLAYRVKVEKNNKIRFKEF